jgi:O-antigen/teichoic acid export membrane protein
MESVTTPQPAEALPRAKHNATSRQIRGSSLMLVGRAISMGLNFVVQILIVRYFANDKGAYGAFAYALSIVALVQSVATFGLDRAVTRFLPIYHERQEYNKLFGTIVMVIGTILSLGIAIILLIYSLQSQLFAWNWIQDQQALALMLILIFLAPVQAIDQLIEGMFAVFSSPRAIFFRKYILSPGLKISVVLLLILGRSDVFFLAGGYLAAGALGVVLYGAVLFNTLRKQGLFKHFNVRGITFPVREVLTFTIPLLTSDLVYILMNSSDAVLLEHFRGTTEVAAFRAVQPAAGLNQLVITSFQLLFTPLAARMFARNNREGINNLYWQTAIWIAVMAFPIFALTFALAGPLTVLLFTKTYADSAIILALLSFGYYFSAALGFNGLTLKVFGKVRYIVVINILAALVNLGINLLLIPRYGALGAAIGTCGTMVAHNIFKQLGLLFGTGINLFELRHLKVYVIIALSTIGLLLIQLTTSANIYVGIALTALVSLVVLALTRKSLAVGQTFPELLRFPLMRRIFGE